MTPTAKSTMKPSALPIEQNLDASLWNFSKAQSGSFSKSQPGSYSANRPGFAPGRVWYQCSNSMCTNNYDESNDCAGFDWKCDNGETCSKVCEARKDTFCYFNENNEDSCFKPIGSGDLSCFDTGCPSGARCVDAYSWECGERVCKTLRPKGGRINACNYESACRNDGECGAGETCVSRYHDCGLYQN